MKKKTKYVIVGLVSLGLVTFCLVKGIFTLLFYFKEKKYDDVELHVHSLKGLAGNLGVNSVYNATCIMLKEIRTGDKEKALNLFKFVEEEFLLAKKMILKADS